MLIDLGISDKDSIEEYYPNVRDRDDISILRCKKSGVLFLSRTDHMDHSHYIKKNKLSYFGKAKANRKEVINAHFDDSSRRLKQFRNLILNKKWIDFGSGVGGVLDLLSPFASKTIAIEIQENIRNILIDSGYVVYSSIEDVKEDDFEVITLFHVFEHLSDPIIILNNIRKKMAKNAKVIIEVPHANDFLLSFLDSEPFKAFTFWSEHLILHTKSSLKAFIKKSGFKKINIYGFQRFPLANHLYWLAKSKPGGHEKWSYLKNKELDTAYANLLSELDYTDTLIAIAEK